MKEQESKSAGTYEEYTSHEEEAVREINQGFDSLDAIPLKEPSLEWFELFAMQEQQRMQRELKKDFAIFALVALSILSVVLVSLYKMPVIFITLQILVTVFVAVYSTLSNIKKVHVHER